MSKRVLICDDSALMRNMIRDTLAAGGWEVAGEAANGDEAIEKFKSLGPDAVTMDIVMPEVDGLTALRGIIELDPQAKVVMISALDQTKPISDAIRAGAQDFICKPFLPEQLQQTMECYLDVTVGT